MLGRRVMMVAVALAMVVRFDPVAAQNYAPGWIDQYFRLEWEVTPKRRGPVVSGYIHNRYGLSADRVRIAVRRVDATGRVVEERGSWVPGAVPAGGRTYFEVPVTDPAGTYLVEIVSFDWVGRGGGGA